MDLAPDHYPDYRPGYTDYDTLRNLLWIENSKITDFAIRKDMQFKPYSIGLFKNWDSFDFDKAKEYDEVNKHKHSDVYIASATIPEK